MKVLSHKDADFAAMATMMKRRAVPTDALRDTVASIIAEVAAKGDEALLAFTQQFDGVTLTRSNSSSQTKNLPRQRRPWPRAPVRP